MQYTQSYDSPLGKIVIACDDEGLTGLWFGDGPQAADGEYEEAPHPHHAAASRWLDDYFARKDPGFLPPLHLTGTPFQNEVWEELLKIPYGQTKSYGEIAAVIAKRRGIPQMSAQAVGGATGSNKIAVIVPCHRVVGADGNLTGYSGGLERKIVLLLDYAGRAGEEVADPWYTGNFEETYADVILGCTRLLESLEKEETK